ncbi:hypothetical protein COOONC_03797 [Cooperia oncophora]
MKLYGKRVFSKQPSSRVSQHSHHDTVPPKSQQFVTAYCASQNGDQTVYQTANTHTSQPQQTVSQQDYAFDYHPQPHASTYIVPNSTSYAPVQVLSQDNTVTSAQDMPANNTISYLTSDQAMPATQPPTTCEQPMLIDYGVSVKDSHSDVNSSQCPRNEASEECGSAPHTLLSSSFSSESGAHKRKTAVPHRRDELVAQTAQSLIVPNGVLLDLESDAAAKTASHMSLLSNIDDTAMQCLDRLINGNLDEVFPFCDDPGDLSGFAAEMENPFPSSQSNSNACPQEGIGNLFSDSAPPPLDVGPSHSPPPAAAHSSKSRSLDEGEIISEENLLGKSEKPTSMSRTVSRADDHDVNTERGHSPVSRIESRRSSLDSGRNKREEKKTAERLKDFSRNPPKSDHSRKSTSDRSELKDAVIFESGNVPRVHTSSTAGSRSSRERTRGFSSLFEEGHSNPSSREPSPHREKLSKKEEERRRREKEMEKERQRDKERLKRQKRDRHRESDRLSRLSPDRRSEKKTHHRSDEEKSRDVREKEKKREHVEERRVVDEAERRKAEEKSRRDMQKKKKEEELEARRQAELQKRAEAMRRKEEEDRKRRQEEKERQEERRREEEKRRMEDEKKRKREEESARREEEKAQRHDDDVDRGLQEDSRKENEGGRMEANSEGSDGQETARSAVHSDQEPCSSDEDNASSADVAHPARNDEEVSSSRKECRSQEQKTRFPKAETRKFSETTNRHTAEREAAPESEDDVAPVSESEERKKKSREEIRSSKGTSESRKPFPPPIPAKRRDEQRKVVKPLEPGMMMSDPGVLDRINKEMESLTPRCAKNND